MIRTLHSMCPMSCHPTLCGMQVTVEDGRLVSIEGDPANPDRDRKSTRLNSSHSQQSRMPSSA